jgi:hypothetical protein
MNGNRMSDPELDELLGAYALNAVLEDERVEIDAYLQRSPKAAGEVTDLQFVASAMGRSRSTTQVPSWERINAAIDLADSSQTSLGSAPSGSAERLIDRPQDATVEQAKVIPFVRRQRTPRWLSGAAAAAALLVLGAQNVQQSRQYTDQGEQLASLREELATSESRIVDAQRQVVLAKEAAARESLTVERIMSMPDSRSVTLTSADGAEVGRVVVDAKGRGFLIVTGQPLQPGQAFQLWGVENESVISLGVMRPNGHTEMPLSAPGDWSKFVLTVEQLPGVVASDGPAVASGSFS